MTGVSPEANIPEPPPEFPPFLDESGPVHPEPWTHEQLEAFLFRDIQRDLEAIGRDADRLLADHGVEFTAVAGGPVLLDDLRDALNANLAAMEGIVTAAQLEATLVTRRPESPTERFRIAREILAIHPEEVVRLEALGFSPAERLGLILQIAREAPAFLVEFRKAGDLGLTPEEEVAIVEDLVDRDPTFLLHAAEAFQFPDRTILELIARRPSGERESLLTALEVPRPGTAIPPPSIRGQLQRLLELRKGPEHVVMDAARRASHALLLVVETAYVDRSNVERDRSRTEHELNGRMTHIGELGSVMTAATRPLHCRIADRDLPAVYKPRRRGDAAGRSIPIEGLPTREWLAFQIDRAFQLDVVPTTVLRDGPDGIGSVQEWKIGRVRLEGWASAARREDLVRMGFLDAITRNTDRRPANMVISADGRVHAIDNALSFPTGGAEVDQLQSYPLVTVAGAPIPEDLRTRIEAFRGSSDVRTALRAAFGVAFGAQADAQWSAFIARVDAIVERGVLPPTEWLQL